MVKSAATLMAAMAACWLVGCAAAGSELGNAIAGEPAAQDAGPTTFFDGPTLAARLTHNLVYIRSEDIGDHGFGIVVGADANTMWVATARHVIVRMGVRGAGEPEQPSQRIRVRLCADANAASHEAAPQAGFDAGGADVALLVLPRPAGYEPMTRVLASQLDIGEPVWLLGSNDECAPVAETGQLRAAADARGHVRIDFRSVQGGSSGAPVATARGVIGLMKNADDLTTTAHAMADLQALVGAARWRLEDARNLPPGDPQAARIDIAETLNGYLLAVNNVQSLLAGTQVARPTLEAYTRHYNDAVNRFIGMREKHDGSLVAAWPAPVWPAWQSLRERLWSVHLTFWRINPRMPEVFKAQQTTPQVRQQMLDLQPALGELEREMVQFLRLLATKE